MKEGGTISMEVYVQSRPCGGDTPATLRRDRRPLHVRVWQDVSQPTHRRLVYVRQSASGIDARRAETRCARIASHREVARFTRARPSPPARGRPTDEEHQKRPQRTKCVGAKTGRQAGACSLLVHGSYSGKSVRRTTSTLRRSADRLTVLAPMPRNRVFTAPASQHRGAEASSA